ncbi:MAG TPA: polysaccharide biosynthesis tyrosine autokinase [Mycobacteriales bacterium]|nr:polysaccharide biosynthesis tyrosine autokinase [Mycobacteriales bacterium]
MDLFGVLGVLRRRWIVILLCLIAGAAGGFDIGHRGTKQYEATSRVLVNVPAAGNVSQQFVGSQLAGNLVQTYANLVTSRKLAERYVETLQAAGIDRVGSVSAAALQNTYLIDISAKSDAPTVAQATANAAAQALVDEVAALQSGLPDKITVQVVSEAGLPGSPVSPRPNLDLIVGIILGLAGGLALTVLLEALDRTVTTVSQADAALDAPLLAIVPKRRGGPLVVSEDNNRPVSEPYRALRIAVRFLDPDQPLRTLLITSPTPDEGKTTTAVNLAVALALSGERVVVVDADLRRAKLASTLGLERSVGLTSVVLGQTTLSQALQDWHPNLKVLASGPLPPNPSEILGSQFVNNMFAELAGFADIVIIDAPPVLPVADAVTLATQVDGVMLVVRHGTTVRGAAAAARRRLDAVGARVVGYVFNAVPRRESSGYYLDYHYGYNRSAFGEHDGSGRAGTAGSDSLVR